MRQAAYFPLSRALPCFVASAQSSTIDIRLCLGATAEGANWAARTRVAKDKDRLLDKKDEVVANTLWRFLELRGCVVFARAGHKASFFNLNLLSCFPHPLSWPAS